ncbi:MAG: hypothetical protein J7K31_02435 [Candidatus Aenigmarchaeota archaeon]|nr:hypothetical protein [Candidatus Aenigmarchaeota archaeon]
MDKMILITTIFAIAVSAVLITFFLKGGFSEILKLMFSLPAMLVSTIAKMLNPF